MPFRANRVGVPRDRGSRARRHGAVPRPILASALTGLLAVAVSGLGCGSSPVVPTPTPDPTQNPFRDLVGPYPAQTPPGTSFAQFAPTIVPGDIYNSPTVSPDGQEIYWAQRDGIKLTTMTSDGHWTAPQPVSFGGRPSSSGDDAPVVSPDNQTLFFSVRTPGAPSGYSYWYAERTASGGSEPRPLPDAVGSTGGTHWQVSVSSAGTLCFGVATESGYNHMRPTLDIDSVSRADGYTALHRQLERSGVIRHPVDACPELQGMKVRMWEPKTGWSDLVVPMAK